MLRLLKTVFTRSHTRTPHGVHFHIGENGREFACHDWQCNRAINLPHLRAW